MYVIFYFFFEIFVYVWDSAYHMYIDAGVQKQMPQLVLRWEPSNCGCWEPSALNR